MNPIIVAEISEVRMNIMMAAGSEEMPSLTMKKTKSQNGILKPVMVTPFSIGFPGLVCA